MGRLGVQIIEGDGDIFITAKDEKEASDIFWQEYDRQIARGTKAKWQDNARTRCEFLGKHGGMNLGKTLRATVVAVGFNPWMHFED